jgi:hypothetical protein
MSHRYLSKVRRSLKTAETNLIKLLSAEESNSNIDKNARFGRNVHIRNLPGRLDSVTEDRVARDGLVIVPKNAAIPDGAVI